jgi:hypothetical protein
VAEGRRVQRKDSKRGDIGPLLQLAGTGVGAVLTGVAWFYMVGAAIDFGVVAVRGRSAAWVFTLGAALGAVVCLVLMLALVGRGLRTLGYISDYKPRRAAARRRR